MDTGDIYEAVKDAFAGLIRATPETRLEVRVPATPAWTIHDALAHVVGLAADLNAARFPSDDDAEGEVWGAAQVASRRGRALEELIAEWDHEAPIFAEGLRVFGYETGSHFVADLHAHYQDVRQALGLSAADDPVVVGVALDHYLGFLDDLLTAAHWGTVDIVSAEMARRCGEPERHQARVRAAPFELLRSFSGRRSARQIRALDWEGDVDLLVAFLEMRGNSIYALPPVDLIE